VDFRLSTRRDVAAAKAFYHKAVKSQGSTPTTITLDGYAASHRAVRELKAAGQLAANTKLRSSKYLNTRWCANRPVVVFPPSRFAFQRIRAETGMPRPVIRLSTLHPTFASVR
jgi:hypothetical protein